MSWRRRIVFHLMALISQILYLAMIVSTMFAICIVIGFLAVISILVLQWLLRLLT